MREPIRIGNYRLVFGRRITGDGIGGSVFLVYAINELTGNVSFDPVGRFDTERAARAAIKRYQAADERRARHG
jgi:hypothetical protein